MKNIFKETIFNEKTAIFGSIFAGFVVGVILLEILMPQIISADLTSPVPGLNPISIIKNGHLTVCKLDKSAFEVVKKLKMMITAYSSTPDQTDDTPFITANGAHVADGIVANNLLPFGTKIRIPQLYGDKVFTVEDRMNSRKGKYQADIWMPSTSEAKLFGAKIDYIEVLEN